MRITIFTSNQPRHISFIEALREVSEEIFAIQEVTTVFPGNVHDFYKKSPLMEDYFERVRKAEREVFGGTRFPSAHVRCLALKMGDLIHLDLKQIEPALHSDLFLVFGASYIRGKLCDFLVQKQALNLHMGTAPYYRGSSCNFWALYDDRADYVGATIHLLSKGLDSGKVLFHALPPAKATDPFVLGMQAVKSAHEGVIDVIKNNRLSEILPEPQDKSLEIRYSKKEEFTDEIVEDYLLHMPSPTDVGNRLKKRDLSKFKNPHIGC